jgi:predicted DNA-binding transcriptional regulator AlpA
VSRIRRKGSPCVYDSCAYRPRVGRRVAVEHLVSAKEIADRLGVARPQVVYEWRRRHPDFPAPLVTLSIGNVWNWPEVERWAKSTGRLATGSKA